MVESGGRKSSYRPSFPHRAKKNVQVHKFVCLGTVEERIDEMIEKKKELAQNIVGTGEAWLTEMSTEQIREVLALSREAVEI